MKHINVFGLFVSALFCASMAACVGSTGPEGTEDEQGTTEPGAQDSEKVGEASEALSAPYCWSCDAQGESCYNYHESHETLYNFCLSKCSATGSKLWYVATQTEVGGWGHCDKAAEWFCGINNIGQAYDECWGNN
jgi:hypothetical protein